MEKEAAGLDRKAQEMLGQLYGGLNAWQKAQVARHPDRPHAKDYIEGLLADWTPLAGDRVLGPDIEALSAAVAAGRLVPAPRFIEATTSTGG